MTGGRDKGRVVLAGGGHAHLYTLTRVRDLVRRGFDVTLVDASPYLHYSGMATGVISGLYAPDEHRLDIRRLVEGGGGRFVRGRIAEVRAGDRELVLEGGERVSYDVASFCLGSEVAADGLLDGLAARDGHIIRVKPVENAREVRDRLRNFRGERPPKVLVVGGGAAGCEVAANVLALFVGLGGGELTLVHGGASLLPSAPKQARAEISTLLRSRGARVLTDTRIVRLDDGSARTAGERIPYDLAVLATGISPSPLFQASGLPTGDGGGLLVNSNLQVSGDERLFGGGDCVSYRGRTLPKLGVFAVRQGPVILHNLQATLEGRPLRRYDPQDRFLYVLNLGDGTGLGVYGDLAWRGRLPYGLKNLIDRRFVRQMSKIR